MSLVTTLLPMVIMMLMRRYVNGMTLTFLSIIEPIISACFAFLVSHERFQSLVYIGGVLAVGSIVLQSLASQCGYACDFFSSYVAEEWKYIHVDRKSIPVKNDDFDVYSSMMQ